MTLETLSGIWLKATPTQRQTIGRAIDAALNNGVVSSEPMPRIISRREVAKLIGRTPKRVDQIAELGVLKRVFTPGTKRAIGYTEQSVRELVNGQKMEVSAI